MQGGVLSMKGCVSRVQVCVKGTRVCVKGMRGWLLLSIGVISCRRWVALLAMTGRGEWVSTTINELIHCSLFGCHIADSDVELDSLSAIGMGEMGSC
jgi:hypothetical protein